MTPTERSGAAARQSVLAVVTGAVVAGLAWGVSYGLAVAIDAALPSPDANIGLGLLMLGLPLLLVPLGVWWGLRRLRVPAAGLIGAGTLVLQLALFATPWFHVVTVVVAVALYTGLAALVAGSGRR